MEIQGSSKEEIQNYLMNNVADVQNVGNAMDTLLTYIEQGTVTVKLIERESKDLAKKAQREMYIYNVKGAEITTVSPDKYEVVLPKAAPPRLNENVAQFPASLVIKARKRSSPLKSGVPTAFQNEKSKPKS